MKLITAKEARARMETFTENQDIWCNSWWGNLNVDFVKSINKKVKKRADLGGTELEIELKWPFVAGQFEDAEDKDRVKNYNLVKQYVEAQGYTITEIPLYNSNSIYKWRIEW